MSPATAPTPMGAAARVEALDLLRLLAAVAVVVFHYAYRGAAADGMTSLSVPEWAPVAKYGYLGVNLFFVISGFVIAWSAQGRTAVAFAIARAARIYPGFLVCMTLTFLVTLAFGAPRFEATLGQWFANLIIAAPILNAPFMDGAYWSIVYELIFYGWVAVLLAAGLFQRWMVGIVLAWLAISLVNMLVLDSTAVTRLFLTSYSGFFGAGIMLFAIRSGKRDAYTLFALAAATAVAVLQEVISTDWMRAHYGGEWSSLTVATVSLAAIAAVALASMVQRVVLPAGLVLALGGLTYPLYLLHQHIGYIAFNRLGGVAPPIVLLLAVTVAMIVLSWVVWRFVERPGIRRSKQVLEHAVQAVVRLVPRLGPGPAARRAS